MKTPRVRLRITAYHSVVASPVPWIRCQGAGGGSSSRRRCPPRRAGAAWRPDPWSVSMKNSATPPRLAGEPRWRAALRCFDARPAPPRRRRAHAPCLRRRPRPVRRAGRPRRASSPAEVDHRVAAPLRRRAVRARRRRDHRRAQARGAARASSARCVEHGRASPPTRPTWCRRPSARRRCRACSRPARSPRCSTGSRPRRRSSCATARCSSSPTPAACAPRSSSTSTSASIDFDGEEVRVEGKGGKTRIVPVGEHALARARRATSSARGPAPAAPADGEPALFLSKSGRRLSTSDVRRRLRVWARRARAAGRGLTARAAPLVRDPPAGGGADLRAIQELLGPRQHLRRPRSTLG